VKQWFVSFKGVRQLIHGEQAKVWRLLSLFLLFVLLIVAGWQIVLGAECDCHEEAPFSRRNSCFFIVFIGFAEYLYFMLMSNRGNPVGWKVKRIWDAQDRRYIPKSDFLELS
ncbi:MAG: hypothetical protein ACRD1T_16360, partial [Acidimicrobiia bacterium]